MADERRGYRISDIYQGSYSGLAPPQDNYVTAGSLGMTTDPRSANIIQEISSKLSSGVKQIEVEGVSPEVFDAIPKQYFKEANRMAKLTGVNLSLHGPVIDVSGIDQRSGFSETNRETAERKIVETLLRSHELNPDGNITVNFHSAEGIPGSQFLPLSEIKNRKQQGQEETQYKRMIVVNKESGRLAPLEEETQYSLRTEKLEPETITPEARINMLNKTEWNNSLNQITIQKEQVDKIIEDSLPFLQQHMEKLEKGHLDPNTLGTNEQIALKHYLNAGQSLHDIESHLTDLFDKVCKYGDDKIKGHLKEITEEFRTQLGPEKKVDLDFFKQSNAMQQLMNGLRPIAPKMYVEIEDFATEQSSKTFGNAAWQSYKQFKDKAPILVIENPPAGFALSTGEDIKNIVESSRKQFIQNAMKEGMPEKEAEKNAEKFIGATWDVGHINMLRKYGYSEEEIVKESEKVAHLVKHIHLSDNFGYEHTELPMGMGNVPLKEIMKKFGEKGFEAKKIIEAGNWWQHFRTPPLQENLEAMGSSIYGMKMAPYWSQAPGLYEGYMSGMEGSWLPQTNYETFGTTFSRLPKELGGQMQGAQGSRMSGRPME